MNIDIQARFLSIDLTRMECKEKRVIFQQLKESRIDLTRMECKENY